MSPQTLLDLLAPLPILGLCALTGLAWTPAFARDGEQTVLYRWLIASLAGLVTLHLWLTALDLAGLPWSLATVFLPLVLGATIGLARVRRRRIVDAPLASPGWGDLGALAALAILAFFLRDACLAMSDFVYHWGIKGHRYLLAGGLDYPFLLQPWNLNKHPDYPNLIPELFAVTALARGGWREPALLAWTLYFALALAIGAREGLQQARSSVFIRHATLAVVVSVAVSFALGAILGGSPDLLLAALLVAASPVLLAPPSDARDGQLGWIGAIAVAIKIEGMPLAFFLVAAQLLRRRRAGLAIRAGTLARLFAPALAVGSLWWLQIVRIGLTGEGRFGAPSPALIADRAGGVALELLRAMANPVWHGWPFLLLLLPWLLLRRRSRPLAAVVTAQLVFYLAVYLTTATDPVWLARTSALRLLLHALPATLLLLAVELGGGRSAEQLGGGLESGDVLAEDA